MKGNAREIRGSVCIGSAVCGTPAMPETKNLRSPACQRGASENGRGHGAPPIMPVPRAATAQMPKWKEAQKECSEDELRNGLAITKNPAD